MKNFTSKCWAVAAAAFCLFAAPEVAQATDFGPAPTTFTATESLNGTYEVTLSTCSAAGMAAEIVNLSDYVLVDASGTKVPYAFVVPEMKDDYTVVLNVNNADEAPAGTYTIKVPAAAFWLSLMTNITSDAFDVTINYSAGGTVDPGTEVDPVNPGTGANVATFTLDDHKSDTSIYFHDGDVINSNVNGVTLRFDRVGFDNSGYPTCYKSNGGFVQFKDCAFTIEAVNGLGLQKIEFVDGAPQSTMYDLDNFEGSGYGDNVWTGYDSRASFSTKEISYAIYDYDDEDNEYITGYATDVTGARVSKIYVTLDTDVLDGIGVLAPEFQTSVRYDLNGRRVANGAAGISIEGGKKVIR